MLGAWRCRRFGRACDSHAEEEPRFTALALLMLTMAIGGTLVFRVLTLHPRTNSVDLDSLQKRLRAAEIPSLHSVLVIQHDQMIVEWYFEGADEDRGRGWLGTGSWFVGKSEKFRLVLDLAGFPVHEDPLDSCRSD